MITQERVNEDDSSFIVNTTEMNRSAIEGFEKLTPFEKKQIT